MSLVFRSPNHRTCYFSVKSLILISSLFLLQGNNLETSAVFENLEKGVYYFTCCDNIFQSNTSVEMDTFLIKVGRRASDAESEKGPSHKTPAIRTLQDPCSSSFQHKHRRSSRQQGKEWIYFFFCFTGFASTSKHRNISKAFTIQKSHLSLKRILWKQNN